MLAAAEARGYMVLMNGAISFRQIKHAMIDGIIMSNQWVAQYYLEQEGRNYQLPIVSASYQDGITSPKPLSIVDLDMYAVMEAALDYIWSMGHRKIALAMPYSGDDASARARSYKGWMRRKELPEDKFYLEVPAGETSLAKSWGSPAREQDYFTSEDYYDRGRLAARIFMERKLKATCIMCFNDDFALGIMRGLGELGIHVPENVSVMGMDGIYTRKYVSPLLTTVATFPEDHGAKCASVLMDKIEGRKVKHVSHVGFKLLPGESVKKL